MITPEEADNIHRIIITDGAAAAANWGFQKAGEKVRAATEEQGYAALSGLTISLLDQSKTTEAALLLWGQEQFDPRPRSVKMLWDALDNYEYNLAIGGGSQGKTRTPAAWFVLFWIHDPKWTSVKVISVTGAHAAANMMASIKEFHENSAIPLPGRRLDTTIDLNDGDKRATIAQVNLPEGEDVKGRLRGFHPILRPTPHHVFGRKSRIAVVIDEGEDVSNGLWEGLENIRGSAATGSRHIVVYAGANPKKRQSYFAQRCEYPGGWGEFSIEDSEEWTGPASMGSWHVTRIDPAKSENIVEKKEVYPGFMTYEGWLSYMATGATHPDALTFARGAWPDEMAEYRVTPLEYFRDAYGEFVYLEPPRSVASCDVALSLGGDEAILTTGRYGNALGWRKPDSTMIRFAKLRPGLQIDQQIVIPKENALDMADRIIAMLVTLGVRPEDFIIDYSGNGIAVHDPINKRYGGIRGQKWTDEASQKKILIEDTKLPEDLYKTVITEMAFCFAIWLQVGMIKIAPMVGKELERQAVDRSYYYMPNGLRNLSDKQTYAAAHKGSSPDRYDSAIMLPHLVRMRDMTELTAVQGASVYKPELPRNSVIDEDVYVDLEI